MPTTVTKVEFPRFTMWGQTPIYLVKGQLFHGLLRQALVPELTDTNFTVTQGYERRLDLIAFRVFEVSQLWWAIAMVNNIVDPLSEPLLGTHLRIPRYSRVMAALKGQ